MRLSDINVNAHGLTKEEVQRALDEAHNFKSRSFQDWMKDWQERRKDIMLQMFDLINEDTDFVKRLIEHIKEHRPDLLKEV